MWGGCVQAYKDFSDKWAYVLDQNMTDAEIASLGEQSYVTLCYVVMLCYVMLCNVMICYVMLCYVMCIYFIPNASYLYERISIVFFYFCSLSR